jgi:(5-formylfuran-3-yl)methyl phosphate synthase
MSLRILVSVRDVAEAAVAADHGADFIDLKDPAAGALGGLPPARIAEVVRLLRARPDFHGRISATIGDWPAEAIDTILARVAAVAATGVDYVKAGLVPGAHAGALIDALAACDATVVPVLIADDGADPALVARALATRAFPALMLDTQDKLGGSLLQCVAPEVLQRFVGDVRAGGSLAGLAGALRLADLPALRALAPDFAGFRSAVCVGDRAQALDAGRLRALRQAAGLAPQAAPMES